MIACANHRVRQGDFYCGNCQMVWCKDCVNQKAFGNTKVEVCPKCGQPAVNLAPYHEVPPIWKRIPKILGYPFQEDDFYITFIAWAIFAVFTKGLAAMAFVVGGGFAFIGGAGLLLIYYSFLISYFYRIIARNEEGKFDVPDFSEFSGVGGSLVWPVIQYYLAFILVFIPVIIALIVARHLAADSYMELFTSPLGIVIIIIGALYGYFIYPMALLLLGVGRSVLPLINPVFIAQQVLKIPKDYLISIGIMAGIGILYALIRATLNLVFTTDMPSIILGIVKYSIDGVVQLYIFMVYAHLLGYLAYQTRFELKWWPENQVRPALLIQGTPYYMTPPGEKNRIAPAGTPLIGYGKNAGVAGGAAPGAKAASNMAGAMGAAAASASVVGATSMTGKTSMGGGPSSGGGAMPSKLTEADMELSRQINDGMAMIDHGRHREALDLFKGLLEQKPDNTAALRGAAMAAAKMKDIDSAKNYGVKLGTALARDKAMDAMYELYTETQKMIPDFVFGPREQIAMARFLIGAERQMEAAKALRAFAVANPEDPISPKALYQCAEILWKKVGKTDTAVQVFQYILKRYPQSPFADQIQMSLKQIKSSGSS